MKKTLSLLLVLVLVMGSLAACTSGGGGGEGGEPAAEAGSTLVLQMYGDIMSFNPDTLSDDNFYAAAQNVYQRLAKLDANTNVIPDLAESWDYSADGQTITFHLAEGAMWHDGEPVTAEDVEYTFEYIRDNDTCVLNYALQTVDDIEAVDEHTAVFHLSAPDMAFVSNLSWYGCFVLPKHILEASGWDANMAEPVGSGPYKFKEYNTGVSLVLEANEDFYGGAPAIKTIVYSIVPDDATALQALLNGELDWVTSIPFNSIAGLEGDSTVRLVPNILPSPQRIVFNVENELVADVAVRKAIAMCIDREDIVEKAYNNVYPVEYCSLPYMSWANNPDATYPAFDIEGASKVLEDAGYTKDADGYYVRGLTITAFESMGNADTAKLISANCEKAGIEMKPDMYEYNAWANKIEVEHSFAIELQGGFLGPDPSALGARVGTGGWASFGYSNARVDELLAAGVAEPDESKRKVYYDEIQEILVEELPYVCIAEYASVEGCASNLKNVPMDGAGKWGWSEWSKAYFE